MVACITLYACRLAPYPNLTTRANRRMQVNGAEWCEAECFNTVWLSFTNTFIRVEALANVLELIGHTRTRLD